MKVIRKDPGQKPKLVEIPNTLEALQEAVGGHIETMTFCTDACVVCDEEGLFKGKEYNCNFLGVNFVGTILLVGVAGEEFCDVPGGEFTLSLMKGVC